MGIWAAASPSQAFNDLALLGVAHHHLLWLQRAAGAGPVLGLTSHLHCPADTGLQLSWPAEPWPQGLHLVFIHPNCPVHSPSWPLPSPTHPSTSWASSPGKDRLVPPPSAGALPIVGHRNSPCSTHCPSRRAGLGRPGEESVQRPHLGSSTQSIPLLFKFSLWKIPNRHNRQNSMINHHVDITLELVSSSVNSQPALLQPHPHHVPQWDLNQTFNFEIPVGAHAAVRRYTKTSHSLSSLLQW